MGIAAVVASLGASLGVGVADLIAAEPMKVPMGAEALQHKTPIAGEWGNINASQVKLADQLKMLEANQGKFINQIKGEMQQGKIDARQFKELQTNEWKLANQIKEVRAASGRLANQLKMLGANQLKYAPADQQKFKGLEANFLKLANQVKFIEVNELKLVDQLKLLQMKQMKH
jgi:hypothetical protein